MGRKGRGGGGGNKRRGRKEENRRSERGWIVERAHLLLIIEPVFRSTGEKRVQSGDMLCCAGWESKIIIVK